MRPSVLYGEREWWRGFPVVICLTRRSAGLYKAESFALSSPSFREGLKRLVNIKRSVSVCSSPQRMESEAPSHLLENAINISWPLISSHRLMRIKRWRVCWPARQEMAMQFPPQKMFPSFLPKENKRSWSNLNRREKKCQNSSPAEKRFFASNTRGQMIWTEMKGRVLR